MDLKLENNQIAALLSAALFAAKKHKEQRRKDSEATPYINHPIAVAAVLACEGHITDLETLQAALLHDTLEDTQTTSQELEEDFGITVRLLVQELSDDKSLAKQERKRLEIEHAPHLSERAKQIKVADKICNLNDINNTQPPTWPAQRKLEYLELADKVVAGCRGCNSGLELLFDTILKEKRLLLKI